MRKRILLVVIICLFAEFGVGQHDEKSPISLSISPLKQQVCKGKPLAIVATVRNTSASAVAIDSHQIGVQPGFWKSTQHKSGSFIIEAYDEISNAAEKSSPEFVVLAPGESHSVTRTYFHGKNVFGTRGKYFFKVAYSQNIETRTDGIRVWVGSTESNEIEVSAKNCVRK